MDFKKIDLPIHGAFLYESKHKDGDVVGRHHHHIHQILYALKGEGTITLNGEQFVISQDCAAVIIPYSEHAVKSESSLTLLVLAFEQSSMNSSILHHLLLHSFQSSSVLKMNAFAAADVRQLLRKMLFEQTQHQPFETWAIQIYLLEMLLVIARSTQPFIITDSNGLRAERIRSYIDTHYYEALTSADIAGRLGISTRHVNNIFKEQYRMTPTQYLTEVRIGLAKQLLIETDKDIVSICFEVGYESLPTYYRVFKKKVEMSPNQFRQLNQKRLEKEI